MIRPDRKTEPAAPLTGRQLGAGNPGAKNPDVAQTKKPNEKTFAAPYEPKERPASPNRKASPRAAGREEGAGDTTPVKTSNRERQGPRPARKMTEQRIRNIAEHYVGSRECTQHMLREVLRRRQMRRSHELDAEEGLAESEAAEALIETEVARLVASGLIDDARYAESKARGDLSRGRGARRILMDLALKGVDKDVAADALKEASRDVTGTLGRSDMDDDEIARNAEWEAAETFARKKRFGPYRSAAMPDDYASAQKIWRREAASMARQGFGLDLIRQIIDREPDDDL